jgi:hypothetical protein
VDTSAKGASTKHELSGRPGVVASATLDQQFGEVRVQDVHGHEQMVHARLVAGEGALVRGAQVVLIEFDPERGVFSAASL